MALRSLLIEGRRWRQQSLLGVGGFLAFAVTAHCQTTPSVPASFASRGFLSSYAEATAIDSPYRFARGSMYDQWANELPLSDASPAGARLSYPQSFARLDRIPLSLSNLVVVGQILKGRSYLSADGTTIYTEFSVQVTEVLSNSSPKPISVGGTMYAVRPGGVVKLPSGKVLIRGSATESLPRKKTNCAMLLHYEASGDVYALVSAFELNGNHVYLIDSTTPKQLLNEFGGNADAFLQLLRSMVSK